jgi:hypothetical protein
MSDVHDTQIARAKVIHTSEVMEYVVDGLIHDMGKLPTKYYDVQIVVTVVVTPLNDQGQPLIA